MKINGNKTYITLAIKIAVLALGHLGVIDPAQADTVDNFLNIAAAWFLRSAISDAKSAVVKTGNTTIPHARIK